MEACVETGVPVVVPLTLADALWAPSVCERPNWPEISPLWLLKVLLRSSGPIRTVPPLTFSESNQRSLTWSLQSLQSLELGELLFHVMTPEHLPPPQLAVVSAVLGDEKVSRDASS